VSYLGWTTQKCNGTPHRTRPFGTPKGLKDNIKMHGFGSNDAESLVVLSETWLGNYIVTVVIL